MKNQLKLLNQLSKAEIEELMNACVSFDAGNILGPDHKDSEVLSYSSPKFGWEWKNKKEFEAEIKTVTTTANIAGANKALERKLVEAPERLDENIPSQAKREVQAEELEARKAATDTANKKGVEDAKRFLDQEAKRAERLKEILKDQKVYVKVTEAAAEKDAQAEILEEQAQASPKKFVEDTSEELKASPTIQNLTTEEKEAVGNLAAVTTYETLTGSSPIVQAAIINSVVSDPEILAKIAPDSQTQSSLKDISSLLLDTKTSQYDLSRQLINLGKIDSRVDIKGVDVKVSAVPLPGYQEYNINQQIIVPYAESISRQNLFISGITSFDSNQTQSRFVRESGAFLDTQVARLPAESSTAHIYNPPTVRIGISSLRNVGSAAWVPAEGSLAGKIIVGSGYGHVAGAVQKFTGLNLGVKAAAKIGTEAITKTGASVAVKTGLKAGISKITTALSTAIPIPGINWIIGWIGGEIIGKIAEKIPWKKLKEYSAAIVGVVAGLIALPFLGIGSAIGIGIGTTIGSVALGGGLGGLTLGGIGTSIGNFFLALGGAFVTAVGIPILVTLLTFPVVVALILFIINSGAYIVPPSPSSLNIGGFSSPYVDIKKTANPAGPFTNSSIPNEVTYTVTITPKKGGLKNVLLSYGCEVVSRSNIKCPGITIEGKNSGIFSKPTDISATGLTFSYKSSYDSSFKDSAVIDSVKLSGTTIDGHMVETETSASVTFGSAPISCPVPGAHTATPSLNFSYNASNNTGHGSVAYWKAMGGSAYRYPLPQSSSCVHPSDCSYYGYAYDVFPTGSQQVFAPTILGKDVTWDCQYAFANPGAGNTYHCISTGGNYMLSLTHMAGGAKTGTIKSGQQIGKLFIQPGNTHLHIEFQLNGRYVKPENYFCGGK